MFISSFFRALVFMLMASSTLLAQQSIQRSAPIRSKSFAEQSAAIKNLTSSALTLVQTNADGSANLMIGQTDIATAIVPAQALGDEATVRTAATKAMQSIATSILELPWNAELTNASTEHVGNLWISHFTMSYNGIPVRDVHAKMNIGALNGKIVSIRSKLPVIEPKNVTFEKNTLSLLVTQSALRDLEGKEDVKLTQEPTLIYVQIPNSIAIRLAFELTASEGPMHLWRYTYDAETSELIEKRDLIQCQQETPGLDLTDYSDQCNTLTNTSVSQAPVELGKASNGNNEPLAGVSGKLYAMIHPATPTDALVQKPLQSTFITVNGTQISTDTAGNWSAPLADYPLTITGKLTGAYQFVKANDQVALGKLTKTIASGESTDVIWDNASGDVSERDAYYNTTLARNHVLLVDKTLSTLSAKLAINVNLNQTCNAFYSPQEISLNFFRAGGGCTNTSQIADVVFHEFGHRVNHARYLKVGKQYMTDGNLNEGYADMVSCLFRNDNIIGKGFFGPNKILRNLDNTKQWPKDIDYLDIHINGLMPGGAIWDIAKKLGSDKTDQLFHQSCYQTPDGTGAIIPGQLLSVFTESLESFFPADDDNNNLADGTPNAGVILAAYQIHNIGVPQYLRISPQIIPDQDASTNEYPVTVKVTYSGPVGTINRNSVKLHYSYDNGKTYSEVVLSDKGGDTFSGTIPKGRSGAIARYYGSATLTYSEVTRVAFPPAADALTFLIGFPAPKFTDHCESTNGWETSDAVDTAKQGLWENLAPFGTYLKEGDFIQQDSDHTPTGTKCFVTGNSATRSPTENALVLGGTTLTSPTIDLSSYSDPVIRYWYFYRNILQEASSSPIWSVKIATTGPTFSKSLQSTSTRTQGWVPFTVRLKDIAVTGTATTKLRFTAFNKTTDVVEAGVDDIEVFEAPPLGVNDNTVAPFSLGAPHPNPVTIGSQIAIPFTLTKNVAYTIKLVNTLGETIYTSKEEIGSIGENSYSLSLPAGTTDGTYFIQLITPDGMAMQKLSIAK